MGRPDGMNCPKCVEWESYVHELEARIVMAINEGGDNIKWEDDGDALEAVIQILRGEERIDGTAAEA